MVHRIWDGNTAGIEIPLLGGDVTEGVVRVGDTVRRPLGAHSELVHLLLDHLESVGFSGAPRFLGTDTAGREVLSFVPGEVAGRPRPAWIMDESRLASVGALLRSYDDAAASLVLPAGFEVPNGNTEVPGIPPATAHEPELIGHVDITPENVVFRGDVAVALIDFDLAKPATRVDELFNAMMWWAPLGDPADMDPRQRTVDAPRRCRILADAYGMSGPDREKLVEAATLRSHRSWHLMKQRAETIGGGWARMWEAGAGDIIKRREAWLEANGPAIHAALCAP